MTVFEQLKKDALYAQQILSKELLCQAYGMAAVARSFGEITAAEEQELRTMTIDFVAVQRLLMAAKEAGTA